MLLKELIADYGYYAVFFGSVAEGETVLVLGGIAAHRGYLDLPWVVAAAFAGGWLGDMAYFFFGRWHGEAFLARFSALRSRADKVRRLIERHPARVVITVRFLYGLRTIGPMVIGTSTIPAGRYVAFSALGALIWGSVITFAGYAFSNAVEALMPEIRHYEEYLFGTVLAAGVLLWAISRARRGKWS